MWDKLGFGGSVSVLVLLAVAWDVVERFNRAVGFFRSKRCFIVTVVSAAAGEYSNRRDSEGPTSVPSARIVAQTLVILVGLDMLSSVRQK